MAFMLIGLDDTDSPAGMCTTYLGAVLIHRLNEAGISVTGQRLIRLNPNVIYKTRGNAAICIEATGDADEAFRIASACIEELAEFDEEKTNPGLVIAEQKLPVSFYLQAVTGFCTIEEAEAVCRTAGARVRKWKNGRGIIGATAAIAAEQADMTWELLAYRDPADKGERSVETDSLFRAEKETFPHTWDTVDTQNNCIVCFPHTPETGDGDRLSHQPGNRCPPHGGRHRFSHRWMFLPPHRSRCRYTGDRTRGTCLISSQ
jgi:tRNA(Ile2)-agmatinylcytidine synthase